MTATAEQLDGKTLHAMIVEAAARAKRAPSAFAEALSPHPVKWLEQLHASQRPKPTTIERVKALVEGREVPPPPPNNFQKSPRKPGPIAMITGVRGGIPDPPAPLEPPPSRDPCWRCQSRPGLCEHTR